MKEFDLTIDNDAYRCFIYRIELMYRKKYILFSQDFILCID